jgi:hypothetical protein
MRHPCPKKEYVEVGLYFVEQSGGFVEYLSLKAKRDHNLIFGICKLGNT